MSINSIQFDCHQNVLCLFWLAIAIALQAMQGHTQDPVGAVDVTDLDPLHVAEHGIQISLRALHWCSRRGARGVAGDRSDRGFKIDCRVGEDACRIGYDDTPRRRA